MSFIIFRKRFLVDLQLSVCKHRSQHVSNEQFFDIYEASIACFSSLLLLLLRDFIKNLRFFYICIFYSVFVSFLIYNINRRFHWLCNFAQLNIGK